MHLVEIFLPVADNDGKRFPEELFATVREELTARFGGVTTFSRAPAHGMIDEGNKVIHDDIVVTEVMVERLDPEWWSRYRNKLEKVFAQDEILVRASEIVRL
jgi:hypothetical protein